MRKQVFWGTREVAHLTVKRRKFRSKVFLTNTKGDQKRKTKSVLKKVRGTNFQIMKRTRKGMKYWGNFALKSSKPERGLKTKRRQHKGGERKAELKQRMGKITKVHQRRGKNMVFTPTFQNMEPRKYKSQKAKGERAFSTPEGTGEHNLQRRGKGPRGREPFAEKSS